MPYLVFFKKLVWPQYLYQKQFLSAISDPHLRDTCFVVDSSVLGLVFKKN